MNGRGILMDRRTGSAYLCCGSGSDFSLWYRFVSGNPKKKSIVQTRENQLLSV